MKFSKILILVLANSLIFQNQSMAEIQNKAMLAEIFSGCVDQETVKSGWGFQYAYCGCFVNKVSRGMTLREATNIGLDILEVEHQGEAAVMGVALANRKIKSYVSECAESAYQQTSF